MTGLMQLLKDELAYLHLRNRGFSINSARLLSKNQHWLYTKKEKQT